MSTWRGMASELAYGGGLLYQTFTSQQSRKPDKGWGNLRWFVLWWRRTITDDLYSHSLDTHYRNLVRVFSGQLDAIVSTIPSRRALHLHRYRARKPNAV